MAWRRATKLAWAGMLVGTCVPTAWAQSAGQLEEHAGGNAYWSWTVLVLLAVIAFSLVFKGTRSK